MPMRRRHALALVASALMACSRGRILSYRQYARVEHETPYVLRFTRERGGLLFYGSAHTYDPRDAQVGQITDLWTEFGPTLAFNEGGDPPAEATVAAAVAGFGESGLVRHLGRRDGVPARSIEPPMATQADRLRALGFEDEAIKLFFVLRQVPQYRERTGAAMDDARAVEVIAYFTRATAVLGGERVFAVMGASHVVVQAPALRARLA